MKKNQIEISVIIVTYNSEAHIFACIDSIYKYNSIGDKLEIVVVDNGSKDVSAMFEEICCRFGKQIVCISNTSNGGYGQGNNVGIKHARGDIILIMNPDVRLTCDVFATALGAFRDNSLCMMGLRQRYSTRVAASSFFLASIKYSPVEYLLNRIFNRLNIYIPSWMCFEGACFFVSKPKIIEAGLFDENIFMYCEEIDLHKRMKQRGKFRYVKTLEYIHLAGNRTWSIVSMEREFVSRVYMCKKYHKNIKQYLFNLKLWHVIHKIYSRKQYSLVADSWGKYLKRQTAQFRNDNTR